MEHRYYPRMRISTEVDIFRRDKLLAHATTRDISLGGMLLQAEPPLLNPNDLIVLRVWMKGAEQVLRGVVVHATSPYAGVRLIDMSQDASRAMFDYLREMEVPLKMALGAFEKRTMP
jgi:hypothetical protein